MKNHIVLLIVILSSVVLSGQDGTVTPGQIQEWSDRFNSDGQSAAAMNAVSSNSIDELAKSRRNLYDSDDFFTYRVKTSGITNQKSSGRCWLFTGMNILRARVCEEKNIDGFTFSHNFNFFYDQLEKANLFLEGMIETAGRPLDDKKVEWLLKNPIGDGGQWTGVVDIIEKYGLVPSEVFPESYHSENTSGLSRLLRNKLRENGMKLRKLSAEGNKTDELRKVKANMLGDIYRILAISLGEPPKEFEWRYEDNDKKVSPMKTYTPLSFYKEFVDTGFRDYVMFMNDPSRDFGKLYEIEEDRHILEGSNWKYINLETSKIKKFAIESLKNNEAMYFSCDVGKQINRDKGTLDTENYDYQSLFGVDFTMDKKERILTYASGSTHGMALIGADIGEDGKPVKWLLENSWGETGHEGNLLMTDEWFDEYMFRIVIKREYIDPEVLKILEQEPVMLPPWDPMFMPDN